MIVTKSKSWVGLVCLLVYIIAVESTGTGNLRHPSFSDRKITQNLDHLKKELSGLVELEVDHISGEHLQFYYFRLHDINRDGFLDGNELYSALTESVKRTDENGKQIATDDFEKYYMEAVDSLLDEADENIDGLVSYEEYTVKARTFVKED